MAMRELIFDIFAIDRASATLARIGGEAESMSGKFGKAGAAINKGLSIASAVIVGTGIASVKTAADMETAMTRLTTTAGESTSNIKMVWSGIDKMAGQVGYSVKELASAMYYVESGGYHGAKGLEVLRVAAQGAKIENADVTDVAHALAGAMNDYRKQNIDAATAMNVMTAAVGHGMMTFQDMAEALPKVGARAAATGIKFQELMAAMATMTQDGLPAAVAATYLGQTIGQLAAPTAKARDEMKNLGINSVAVSQAITSGSGHGLGDAIKMLYDGITSHLNPAGLVAIETFKKSKASVTDYQKLLADLPPTLQTSVQALASMTGGVKSFQGILMLGGANTKAYNSNLAAMNDQLRKGHGAVAGVAEQQATLNGKLADAKGAWSALLDQWGQQLLPLVTQMAGKLLGLSNWLSSHGPQVKALAGAIIAVTAAVKVLTVAQAALDVVLDANPIGLVILAIAGLTLAIIDAWQHSEGFRSAMTRIFDVLKIGWYGFAYGAISAIQRVGVSFLEFVGTVIDSAARAFGWVPGLGPKLRGAAADVDAFKNSANASLERIKNELKVNLDTSVAQLAYDKLVANMAKPVTVPVFLQTNYTGGSVNVAGVGRVNVGMRAGGGPVDAGSPYIVGEKGPELIIPRQSGHVIDAAGTQAALSNKGHGAALHIENYYEAKAPIGQIAADLMFKMAAHA